MKKNKEKSSDSWGKRFWENRFAPFLRFFISKIFLVNLVLVVLVVLGLMNGTLDFLDEETEHGVTYTVPDLRGRHLDELDAICEQYNVTYVINDSTFEENDTIPRGAVINQDQRPGKQVKRGRKIYLTIRSINPEMKDFPKIMGISKRWAEIKLGLSGFKWNTSYRPYSECIDCVIEVLHNGQPLEGAGGSDKKVRLPKGSKVELVLGQGQMGERVPIPNLRGKTIMEAKSSLSSVALSIDAHFDGCATAEDTAAAKVYKQFPWGGTTAVGNAGDVITIHLKLESDTLQ